MRRFYLVAFAFCTQLLGAPAGVASPSGQECPLPFGWDAVMANKPRFVVFGEIHGTWQGPGFFGDVACALASRGERILVAVEHSSTENAAFQKAWRLSDARFATALKRAGWADRNDGVGSQAMLELLIRLHRQAQRGRSIDIVAFSGMKDEAQARRFAHLSGQGPHDAAQAKNIREAAAARHYDHVLVLVGNAHARKRLVRHSSGTFRPMVMQLGRPAEIVTLSMEVAGGTTWSCELAPNTRLESNKPVPANAIVCGIHRLGRSMDLQRESFMALSPLPGHDADPNYDGIFWVGNVSASPPAVPVR